ncbi:MAG: serine protease Do [Myxococcota bacterium]|jgi:serine protease Do
MLALVLVGCPDDRPPDYFEVPPVTALEPGDDTSAVDRDTSILPRPDARADTGRPIIRVTDDATDGLVPQSLLDDQVPSFVRLFRERSPSVVNIYTQEVVRQRVGALQNLQGTSLGSGIVVDTTGHILTNAHVVENAAEIRVRFHNTNELPARLVGIDPVRDLALLKVDGAVDLRPVEAGDSDGLPVGSWVVAIGNPFGLSHTMTKGIVSGKGRAEFINDRVGYLDLIQTDAAINRGSSGGPLFDMAGRIVGVNTAVNAEAHGIAFAIPWKVAEEAIPRLMQGGQVSRSWLGVYILGRDQESGGGVLCDAVVEDSPAAKADLRPGDIIVALDGRPVEHIAEFRLRVASAVAGRAIAVDIIRAGKPLRLTARLEEARDIR